MKKVFIVLGICLFSFSYTHALPYVTLASCGYDPLKYIEKNYEDNGTAYIGKTIGYWIDQCELDLSQYLYMPVQHSSYVENKNLIGKIRSIRLDIYYKDVSDFVYYIYIYIDDSTAIDYQSAADISGYQDEALMPKYYNFYKNAKIKRMRVSKEINGTFNKNYRRPDRTIPPVIPEMYIILPKNWTAS